MLVVELYVLVDGLFVKVVEDGDMEYGMFMVGEVVGMMMIIWLVKEIIMMLFG